MAQNELKHIGNSAQCLAHAELPINVRGQSVLAKLLIIEHLLYGRL